MAIEFSDTFDNQADLVRLQQIIKDKGQDFTGDQDRYFHEQYARLIKDHSGVSIPPGAVLGSALTVLAQVGDLSYDISMITLGEVAAGMPKDPLLGRQMGEVDIYINGIPDDEDCRIPSAAVWTSLHDTGRFCVEGLQTCNPPESPPDQAAEIDLVLDTMGLGDIAGTTGPEGKTGLPQPLGPWQSHMLARFLIRHLDAPGDM